MIINFETLDNNSLLNQNEKFVKQKNNIYKFIIFMVLFHQEIILFFILKILLVQIKNIEIVKDAYSYINNLNGILGDTNINKIGEINNEIIFMWRWMWKANF